METHTKGYGALAIAFAKLAAGTYAMSLVNCIADDRGAAAGFKNSDAKLPDLGFDVVQENQSLLPFIDLTSFIQYGIVLWHFVSQQKVRHLAVFIELHAAVLFIRCLTVASTILPTYHPCQNEEMRAQEIDTPLLLRPLVHFSTPSVFMSWCHDFIFSGHMALLVLGVLTMVKTRAIRALQALAFVNGAAGIYFLLATRSHYTVDIVLSLIIVPLLFKTQEFRFVQQDTESLLMLVKYIE